MRRPTQSPQIQETTTIDIEYLVERIGIQSPPASSAASKASSNETISSALAAVNQALEQMPYQRVKRAIDLVIAQHPQR
jgi:hypothetical protein